MDVPFVVLTRGECQLPFSEIEWYCVRRWNLNDQLLLTLISFSNGTLYDEEILLVQSLFEVGASMLSDRIESSCRFTDDPLLQEVKRQHIPWRHIGDTVDRVKIGNRVVGDYDAPDSPQPATWAKLPAASGALAKLERLLAENGPLCYEYAQPTNYETF